MKEVTIVGGGLAGSEAALQLADRGAVVRLYEMRPETPTGAHKTDKLGEIVCSNSFKSTLLDNASGILKAEMELLGCKLLPLAHDAAVPAGHALAIDRDLFSASVTAAVEAHPGITIERRRVDSLDLPFPAILATGPLTGDALSAAMQSHCSSEHLFFFDAIAPSLDGDSIDADVGFWASRYDKGDADYLNIPLDRDDYARLVEYIRAAEYAQTHAFEQEKFFEACLPIEVMVARGVDTMRFGPMKPKGLIDPRTGREPYAAIQLRQESRVGSLLGIVGFQTRMTWACQKEMIRMLPGLQNVKVLRFGTIHRNIFLNVPGICERYLEDKKQPGLFYAGQICGVEGYVESIASAIVVALQIYAKLTDAPMPPLPESTMMGALMNYVHTPNKRFQPMNANMGIIPSIGPRGRGGRKARNEAMSTRARSDMEAYRSANAALF